MKAELLTRDELAQRFGVDVRTVTNWVQAGMPQRFRSGKPVYAWHECLTWREKAIRDDARATRHAGGDEEAKKEAAELKLRRERTLTEREELETAKIRGELVPLAFMLDEFRRVVSALRVQILAIPPAWAARLAECRTVADRQLLLRELANELLVTLGKLADDDGDAAGSGQEAA